MNARVLIAAVLLGTSPVWALLDPPTDEQIAEKIAAFQERTKDLDRTDNAGRQAAAREIAGDLPVHELSVDQIQKLEQAGILIRIGKRDETAARLQDLAKLPTSEGARAALKATTYLPTSTAGLKDEELAEARRNDAKARAKATLEVLNHPGLRDALNAGHGAEIFGQLSPYNAEALAGMEQEILAFEPMLTENLPASVITRATGYFDLIASEELNFDAATRERIRTRLIGLMQNAQNGLAPDDRVYTSLERSRNYLQGAFARGQLVGHTAPELDIIWSNHKEPLKSLADLRGKVVVIDFWATWCGPCIGSFPQVRELVSHYEGYPVVVLGVTSLQGYHINHKAEKAADRRIDTKDDPDRELALMNDFVEQMEVTWPVAFAKQEVFNPDYGVRGIPHVAIIDPKGVVRYRGLHPARPLAEKTEKIDKLLQELGLPTPPAPVAAAEPAKAGAQ